MTPPKVTLVRWLDACQREAADSPEAIPELAELQHVGFVLAETDDILLIGMEIGAADVHPGRYRFNIPKNSILERRDVEIETAFKTRKRRGKTK